MRYIWCNRHIWPGNNRSLWLGMLLVLGVSAFLGACGSTTNTSAGTDRVTASDETDVQKRARIRLELAKAYLEDNKPDIALDEIKQAIAIFPRSDEAYNLRGLIYANLGDNPLAESSFRQALSIRADNPDAMHNYGWMLCQNKRFAEASAQFKRALSVPSYRDKAKTWLTDGICLARAGRNLEAETSLQRSFELDSTNPVTIFSLSQLLYQRGDYTRAQSYIRRINTTEMANAGSLWLGAKIERKLGNTQVMQQLLDQIKRRFPDSREAMLYDRRAFDE